MIPAFVKPFLWSFDQKNIDSDKHKKAIVNQVLNYGDYRSSDWVFRYYGKKEVEKIASKIPLGQWDKKSLALWSLVLKIKPGKRSSKINQAL